MQIVSISGMVASGKTTLLERLLERLGSRAMAHEEFPQNNPFIRGYYDDSKRWSFHSQMTFLALYLDDMRWRDVNVDYYFYDRCLIENLVIAKYRLETGDLTGDEYRIIEKMAKGLETLMPPIDRYICLRCSVPTLVHRMRERNRPYEQGLDEEYSRHQTELYEEWYASLPQERVLYVDEDHEVDLDGILRFLQA